MGKANGNKKEAYMYFCEPMGKGRTVILILGILFGCQDIDNCTSDSNTDFMIVRFFDFETKAAKKVRFLVSTTEGSSLFGFPDDSLAIGLPLDPMDTSLVFVFDSDTSDFDYELEVRYDPTFQIFDPDCPPSLFFNGLDTLRSTFDSTSIQSIITNRQVLTNFEVYF